MRKNTLLTGLLPAVLLLAAGCTQLDVIGNSSIKTFKAMLSNVKTDFDSAAGRWNIYSPGSEVLAMAATYDANLPDFTITLDALSFLAAGLNPASLPAAYSYNSVPGMLTIAFDLSSAKLGREAAASPLDLYTALVRTKRDAIGYHEALDHYGIALGGGNMFEWAKDIVKNDKDLVFVLNPEPFIKAGLDVQKLEEWVYAEVPVMDENGKQIKVFKLLKPYNFE